MLWKKAFSGYNEKSKILLSILCYKKKKKISGYNIKSEILLTIFCH